MAEASGGIGARRAVRRKPRIEFKGVPISWAAKELGKVLWMRLNEKLVPAPEDKAGLIKPLVTSIGRNKITSNWILEVHRIIRFHLMNEIIMAGGWWSLTFSDYLDALRCLKWQGYGHTKATCSAENVVCKWCAAGGHIAKKLSKKVKEGQTDVCQLCARECRKEQG